MCCRAKPSWQSSTTTPPYPIREMPSLMQALRQREGTAARALEFTILTAARTGEVIGAGGRKSTSTA